MGSPLNLLTDIEGVAVGHATDLALGSGVTAIVFEKPAIASGTVLGGAPGGRETALLDPSMTVETVDAFVLSGGSAFGLDAAGGVQSGLREIGRGFQVGHMRVPIVPQAILMDLLNGGDKDWGLHAPYARWAMRPFRPPALASSNLERSVPGQVRRPPPSRAAWDPQVP
ncbi:S58 family peptidase [Pseudorhizobium endolithicum]|uniref:S58 family peptidase n=1 Tax=Pseudorhizobium endolithicum TaxID=1191678 RepID=A0ABM8PVE2_9HYPH|nr:S58 family peptidase [Pseudorhizobium endolithicum]